MKNSINLNFIINDSAQKYYFLGFFSADGCIHNNSIIICLHKKDKLILEEFCDYLKISKSKIKIVRESYVELRKYNKSFVDILKQYNITERKSNTFIVPDNIPNIYVKDYIRGYFDGDGSCFLNSQKNKLYFSIVGTKSIVLFIKNEFFKYFGCNIGNIQQVENKSQYRLIYNGCKSSIEFGNWLYSDITTFCLLRKKEIYEKFKLDNINKFNSGLNFKQAQEIRKKYISDNITQKELALQYNVCRQYISDIINFKVYRLK